MEAVCKVEEIPPYTQKEGCAALPNTLPIPGELDCTKPPSHCALSFAALLSSMRTTTGLPRPLTELRYFPRSSPFPLLSLGITHAVRSEKAVPALLFDRHRSVPMIDASQTAPNDPMF